MSTITYKQLRTFNGSVPLIQKLYQTPMSPKLSYAIQKLLKALGKAGQQAQVEQQAWLAECKEKYGERENGVLKTTEDGGVEMAPDQAALFQKAQEEFEGRTADLGRPPLPLSLLLASENLHLTVGELEVLECMTEDDVERGSLQGDPGRGPEGPGPRSA